MPESEDHIESAGAAPLDSARPLQEPPPSLVPPRDSARPAYRTLLEFPPAPSDSIRVERGTLSRSRIPPSPPSRSILPLPAVEPILELASEACEKADWESALEQYKKALFVLGSSPSESTSIRDEHARASIYASVAEVKLAQGKLREAETNFEKALVIHPKHERSLAGLIAVATELKEWDRVAIARRRRAEATDDAGEKAAELYRVAEIEEEVLGDVAKATVTLERASVFQPADAAILSKRCDLYARGRAWAKMIDTLDSLVRVTSSPRERGAYRFTQADVVLGRLREEPRGLAFLEMALDEDPGSDRALSALIAVRTRREEWAELSTVYERLVDRYAGLGDRDRAFEICRKLGALRRDRLLDGPGALEAFRGAVDLFPDDVETRAALAELLVAKSDRARAVRELEIVSTHAPLRAQTYRRLFDLHQRAGQPDRAWLVATCLEDLGASDVAQDLVIEQFRTNGPIRPTTAVAERWWDALLVAEGADPIVSGILRTIGDAAIALRLEELDASKRGVALDPSAKQDNTSTASAVRSFAWAARALGVTLPDLYVLHDVPSGAAAIPLAAPSTALGGSIVSGRTVQELAFFAGRHLTYYRAAYYPLVFFPTLAELSGLVRSAMRLVIPGLSLPPSHGESRVESRLGSRLTIEQKSELEKLVALLEARGGQVDLLAFIRGVELTAARAGLLLAGDLRTAMRLIRGEERTIGELDSSAKRGDLLSFCASAAYAELREHMGVSIHPGALPTMTAVVPSSSRGREEGRTPVEAERRGAMPSGEEG